MFFTFWELVYYTYILLLFDLSNVDEMYQRPSFVVGVDSYASAYNVNPELVSGSIGKKFW